MAKPEIKKSVGSVVLFENGSLLFKKVLVSYPNVVEARAMGDDAPRFGIDILIDAEDQAEEVAFLKSYVSELAKTAGKDFKVTSDKIFFRKGNEEKPEQVGKYLVRAGQAEKDGGPVVVDAYGKPIKNAKDIYGGCFCHVVINPWVQNNKYGKRINASILTVKKVADGEPFGSGVRGDQFLDVLADLDDEDDGLDFE